MLLEVKDLSVYYGAIHALQGISFEVGEGEVVSLIGANGAGKSTTLKTVSGILHPRSGQVLLRGETLAFGRHDLIWIGRGDTGNQLALTTLARDEQRFARLTSVQRLRLNVQAQFSLLDVRAVTFGAAFENRVEPRDRPTSERPG